MLDLFYVFLENLPSSTTPRVGSAEGGGASGGITMLHLFLQLYRIALFIELVVAAYGFNASANA